jgi:hypothetical protein
MRVLVFLLVLVNLLFLAYTQGYFGVPQNPDAQRWGQQVQPDKLTVASRGAPPPLPAGAVVAADNGSTFGALPDAADAAANKTDKAAEKSAEKSDKATDKAADKAASKPADKNAPVCLAWNNMSNSDADRLQGMLSSKWSAFKVVRHQLPVGAPYWVFVPPLPNKAAAERKASELKALGVADYFIVQESGVNHFAVSLGVFSTEQAAKDRLEVLRGQGVRSAQMGPRNPPPATVEARGAPGQADALRRAATVLLPRVPVTGCTG